MTTITLLVGGHDRSDFRSALRSHSPLIQWVANDLGAFMNTTQTQPNDVIDQMVALRKQLAQLEAQIEALKPAFFNACAAQEVDQFQHPQAVIYRRLTPGKWDYPSDLIEQVEVRSIGRRR